MNVIRGRKHELFSEKTTKVALSARDDKRVTPPDNNHMLLYRHLGILVKVRYVVPEAISYKDIWIEGTLRKLVYDKLR